MRTMYIIVNSKGERLWQYPATSFIDVAQRYRLHHEERHGAGSCRVTTEEMGEIAYAVLSDDKQ